jgi:hypothetical protein
MAHLCVDLVSGRRHPWEVSVAFFPYGDPELEAYGVRLLATVSRLLREQMEPPELPFVPVGPGFAYEGCPDLFAGRRGYGPLDVVLDTNLLIDYFQHGRDRRYGRSAC